VKMTRFEVAVDVGAGAFRSFQVLATDFTTAGTKHDGSVTTFWQVQQALPEDANAAVAADLGDAAAKFAADLEVRIPAFQVPSGRIIWIRDVDTEQADQAQLRFAPTRQLLEELAVRGEWGLVTELHETAQRLLESLAPNVLSYRPSSDDD
jgi:hypothetical protein